MTMPGALSNFLENKLVDHSLGTAAWTAPSAVYLELYTTAPTDSTAGVAVSGAGYARQVVAFDAAVNGSATNSGTITFSAGAEWGQIVAIGVFDDASAGNLLWYGSLTSQPTVTTDDDLEFEAGSITIALD